MPTVSSCKANLTKALTALEALKGNINPSLLSTVEANDRGQYQALDARSKQLQTTIADVKSALNNIGDRRKAFLDLVRSSSDQSADQAAYDTYMQETRVDDAVVQTESLLITLQYSLEEVQSLMEECRSSQTPPMTQPSNTATEASESSVTTAPPTGQEPPSGSQSSQAPQQPYYPFNVAMPAMPPIGHQPPNGSQSSQAPQQPYHPFNAATPAMPPTGHQPPNGSQSSQAPQQPYYPFNAAILLPWSLRAFK